MRGNRCSVPRDSRLSLNFKEELLIGGVWVSLSKWSYDTNLKQGTGFEKCTQMYNEEFERVFMKNNFASAPGLVNVYMTFVGISLNFSTMELTLNSREELAGEIWPGHRPTVLTTMLQQSLKIGP
jgi:hypothetical protein